MVLGNIFHWSRVIFRYKTVTFYGFAFQQNSRNNTVSTYALHSVEKHTPQPLHHNACRLTWRRFRHFPFRSPLLRESLCFLFLALLRCFSSCRLLYSPMYSDYSILGYQDGFPHSEIFGSTLDWQLTEAYGSLPPPSSPPDAKASTKCSFQLAANLY